MEDHLALRKGLELLLRDAGFTVVGVTDSVKEGQRMLQARRPDVSVVDIGLASGSGLDLVRHALAEDPEAGILVYTGGHDPGVLQEAVAVGARGLALKSGPPEELQKAIRAVGSGGVYVDPTLARLLPDHSDAGNRALLSGRERELLAMLAEGLSGEEAATRLYLSPETVRTHIRNAMRKLNAKTRVHALALALRHDELSL